MLVDTPPKLTARQQQIFDLVRDSIESTGSPPTRAEIAQQLGFKSANAAEEHLQALARKGVIELVGGTARGIRLPSTALRQVNRAREHSQFALPLASLAQLTLPLVGRVAAGAPILAEEHVEQHYSVDPSMFSKAPDFLLRVKGIVKLAEHPDRPVVVHGVQHIFHPTAQLERWPDDDRRTRLVFITRDLPEKTVQELFGAFIGTVAPDRPDRAALTDNPLIPFGGR